MQVITVTGVSGENSTFELQLPAGLGVVRKSQLAHALMSRNGVVAIQEQKGNVNHLICTLQPEVRCDMDKIGHTLLQEGFIVVH